MRHWKLYNEKTRRNEIKDVQTQGRNRTTTKMKTRLQGETIDSNENLIEGIEEKQENNQVNENDIKKEVEGESLRNHG